MIRTIQRNNNQAPARRKGAIIVMFALMLAMMVGLLGLVIDTGFLLAGHREAQNMADTAALAYAMDRLRGENSTDATATARTYVRTHNGHSALADGDIVLNEAPTYGPYKDKVNHVEAIVTLPVSTYFIHILGIGTNQTVEARAVSRWDELRVAGQGAIVLDPRNSTSPGIQVGGQGRLVVRGGVFNNNEGGGVDEDNQPSQTDIAGNNGVAASAGQPNSNNGIITTGFFVVGGVDSPDLFKNIDTTPPEYSNVPNILHANSLPLPDPLANLPVPTHANGVLGTKNDNWRVDISNNNVNDIPDMSWINMDGSVTLQPGVYRQIKITGGTVTFSPGIYVIAASGNNALAITGGTVSGDGIMFYNTGANYEAASGGADANDPYDPQGQSPPPNANQSGTTFGDVSVNSLINFTPIDTDNPAFDYSSMPGIATFNGMLFFQRRGNNSSVAITGNAADGFIGGTIYAKWARFQISGQGVYDAQFIVGSMDVTGQADVTLNYTGQGLGRAPSVFLVE